MSLKDILKTKLLNPEDLLEERRKASKHIFIISTLLFFVNYFFLAMNFWDYNLLISIIPFTYISFVISTLFVIYFSVKSKLVSKIPQIVFYIFFVILAIIWVILWSVFLLKDSIFNLVM